MVQGSVSVTSMRLIERMGRKFMMIKVLKWVLVFPITLLGIPKQGKMQSDAIRMLATLHPKLPNLIALFRSKIYFGIRKSGSSESTQLIECNLEQLVTSVKSNGFYVIKNGLSETVIQGLRQAVSDIAVTERTQNGNGYSGKLSEVQTKFGRYDIQPKDLMESTYVREFAFSRDWKIIGDAIMGYPCVFDGVAAWWMFESDPNLASLNAQAFHSDRERLSFIKFFVYLTDIDESTGPHVYAGGTHRKRKISFRNDRRYSDKELLDAGMEMTPIYGKAGTIIVANTQGLHKGVAPTIANHGRLLFQIQVADSLNGMPRDEVETSNWSAKDKELGNEFYFEGYNRA